jgi:hypothetical protein
VKLDVRSTKCVFVGYAVDHSGDTYKLYNPLTKSTILSCNVHQWMEWHGRTTATDDLDLFTKLKKLKMDSVILPATPAIPILTDADVPDDSMLSEVPALAPIAEDVPATQAPTGVVPPARRNLTSSFGQGAVTRSHSHQGVVTRSQVCHVTFADVGHRSDDTTATSTMDIEKKPNIKFNVLPLPPDTEGRLARLNVIPGGSRLIIPIKDSNPPLVPTSLEQKMSV